MKIPLEHNQLPDYESNSKRTDVVIIGGSLSGLALQRELEKRGISHLVFESSPKGKSASIHYLTSKAAAESLGIGQEYKHAATLRKSITGYCRFDGGSDSLKAVESLNSDSKGVRDGFITFSLHELRQFLGSSPHILNGVPIVKLNRDDNKEWVVTTRDHQNYKSKIVINATGSRARVFQNYFQDTDIDVLKNRTVRACFGGVYPYFGYEDKLLFIDKFPTSSDLPMECAGWVMPLGNNLAEVIVGFETPLKDINTWHTSTLKELIMQYIQWFNQRGIRIDFDSRSEVVSGSFSEEFIDYRKLPQHPGLALFGESLGLNHPLNGYLIRNIATYSQVMTDQIEQYLHNNTWNPHQKLLQNSSINFGQQVALSRKKQKAALSGLGRAEATKRMQAMLIEFLGEDGLWEAIDNQVDFKLIIAGLLTKPKYIDAVFSLGIDYLKLILKDTIYRQELKLKIMKRLKIGS